MTFPTCALEQRFLPTRIEGFLGNALESHLVRNRRVLTVRTLQGSFPELEHPMSKILIVDDSATMRKILMRSLRQAGIDCEAFLEAANGAEGLAQLNADAAIDVVLSDVNMPVMNGLDFVKAVRARAERSSVPILMVTTEGSDASVKSALDAGASGYLTKPFTPESLKTAFDGLKT